MRNVFILGAGSSHEYGLPTWEELSGKLHDTLKRLQSKPQDLNTHMHNAFSRFTKVDLLIRYPVGSSLYDATIVELLKMLEFISPKKCNTLDEALVKHRAELAKNAVGDFGAIEKIQYIELVLWVLIESLFLPVVNELSSPQLFEDGQAITVNQPNRLKIGTFEKLQKGWFYDYLQSFNIAERDNQSQDIYIDFNYDSLLYIMLHTKCVYDFMPYLAADSNLENTPQHMPNNFPTHINSDMLQDFESSYQRCLDVKSKIKKYKRKAEQMLNEYGNINRLYKSQNIETYKGIVRIEGQENENLSQLTYQMGYMLNQPSVFSRPYLCYHQPHGYFAYYPQEVRYDQLPKNEYSLRGHEPMSCNDQELNDLRVQTIRNALREVKKIDKLIVMGVGPTALKQNLDKLDLSNIKHLNSIHYTCHIDKDKGVRDYHNNKTTYRNYFKETFKHIGLSDENIKEYNTCSELAARLFR